MTANINLNFRLGGADRKLIAATADDFCFWVVLWVYIFFHFIIWVDVYLVPMRGFSARSFMFFNVNIISAYPQVLIFASSIA